MKPRIKFDARSIARHYSHEVDLEYIGLIINDIFKIAFDYSKRKGLPIMTITISITENDDKSYEPEVMEPMIKFDGTEFGYGEQKFRLDQIGYLFHNLCDLLFNEKARKRFEPISLKICREIN